EIADVVARANANRPAAEHALLCVDGVHGFGVDDVTVGDLGCDFFVAGCHKWMLGPRGTGIIWGKTERWPLLRPTIPHFGSEGFSAWLKDQPPPPTNANMMTPGGFHSFEHRWALREAFVFHQEVGKTKIMARIHDLNRKCKDGLAMMRHVTLHTPRAAELSAGITTFEVAGVEPAAAVKRLYEHRVIATQTPYRESYVRVAPGLYNSEEDVEEVLRAVRALA
ncbi:MAG: aminotransferase class V-fold PLP-dependent enzyme, partial [Polyangiaceae bacterium]|nr:aminotransferase class V-fold PLP-dependent enzyme [Polyangiaceae bacterium]